MTVPGKRLHVGRAASCTLGVKHCDMLLDETWLRKVLMCVCVCLERGRRAAAAGMSSRKSKNKNSLTTRQFFMRLKRHILDLDWVHHSWQMWYLRVFFAFWSAFCMGDIVKKNKKQKKKLCWLVATVTEEICWNMSNQDMTRMKWFVALWFSFLEFDPLYTVSAQPNSKEKHLM